jgi:preprotein translocase subunit SecG
MAALLNSPFASTLVTVIHVFTCVMLILVVLIQSGKGAEISASFSGSSQTVFGSSGGANFFTHFTRGAAAVFMVTSILLTVMGSQNKRSMFETPTSSSTVPAKSALPGGPATPAQDASKPAAPAPAAPAAPKK